MREGCARASRAELGKWPPDIPASFTFFDYALPATCRDKTSLSFERFLNLPAACLCPKTFIETA